MLEPFGDRRPSVHPDAFVHHTAVLIGDVRVGALSSIWPNTTLRADDGPIEIGERTSIQDGTVIHCTRELSQNRIGSRVTVGHSVVLHGVTLEDDCLVGMGAIVLDNARVESGAVVAAGTLVPPGKVVPAGMLVMGNPFRVVRACGAAERELIEFSWREYVARTRQYGGGEPSP